MKNPWWEGHRFEYGVLRRTYVDELEQNFDKKIIQVLTGLRRVGKSTITLQLIHRLIQKRKVDPRKILFFSIESPSLSKMSIENIINEFRVENNLKTSTKIYVFIDEIQFRENWELEIKSLYDTENIKFVLTGSSALLLSEKLSYLTGRYIRTQVFPLSFREYIRFRKIRYRRADEFLLLKSVEDFLINGGMPEYVLSRPDRYLETTVESILFKDLVSKFQLRNPAILTDLLYLLADRVGSTSSSLKLSRLLEINKDTVLTYLDYLKNTYLISDLPNYSTSRNKAIYNPDKIYFEDTAILNKYASKINMGASAENALFLHIRRSLQLEPRIKMGYVYENNGEIDFAVTVAKSTFLFESKWVSDYDEINFESLKVAIKLLKPTKVFYVTRSLEGKRKIGSTEILFIPLYKVLRLDLVKLCIGAPLTTL